MISSENQPALFPNSSKSKRGGETMLVFETDESQSGGGDEQPTDEKSDESEGE
jgi:hypothetical protein